jgi:hypothetical protein
MIKLIQVASRNHQDPKEELIAEMLIEAFTADPLAQLSAATVNRSVRSMVRYIQLVMEYYGYTWDVLKQLAGMPSK